MTTSTRLAELGLSDSGRRTTPPPISTLMQSALANPNLISLAAGFVDPETLPTALVGDIVAEFAHDPALGRQALQYGSTGGSPDLRWRMLAEMEREDRVPEGTYAAAFERTLLTTGSQQLLSLAADALLDPGDIVLVDSPTYFVFLGMMASRGVRTIGIETDEGGLNPEALAEKLAELEATGELARVKMVSVVSEHSNPTGVSLLADRRLPLVETVRRFSERAGRRIVLIEDAAYRGLGFDPEAPEPPSLFALDPQGEVVLHARTFSKTFSPGMKVGFGVVPVGLIGPLLALKGNQDFGSAHLNQVILSRAMADDRYHEHRRRVVAAYRRKRDVVLEALEEEFGPSGSVGISWTVPQGGMYVWLTLPETIDTGPQGDLFERACREGVLYVPGEFCFAAEPTPPRHHIRLCYGLPPVSALSEGIARLATAIRGRLDQIAVSGDALAAR